MGQVLFPLYSGCAIALYPPVVDTPDKLPMMPTPESILDHAKKTGVNVIATVPTQIQAWSQDPKAIKFLSSLVHVVRPLRPEIQIICQPIFRSFPQAQWLLKLRRP